MNAKRTFSILLLLGLFSFPSLAAEVKEANRNKVTELTGKLSSPLEAVRMAAAEGLGQIGEPAVAAVPALIKALSDENVVVRNHSAWALGKIKSPSEQIVPALFRKIEAKDEEWTVRHNASLSLSWIGQPAVVTLKKGLSSQQAWTRAYSADALLRINQSAETTAAVGPTVKQLLLDENAGVRTFGARMVPSLGEVAAVTVPALTALLGDRDVEVRKAAIQSLALVGKPAASAVPRILKALKEDEEQWVRIGAANALGEIGRSEPASIPALVSAFGDAKERVGAYAIEALVKFGESAVPALQAALRSNDKKTRMSAVDVFILMGAGAGSKAEASADLLIQVLKTDKEPDVRFRAANALAALGIRSESVVGALNNALKDEDEYVRLNAGEALARLGKSHPSTSSSKVTATPPDRK